MIVNICYLLFLITGPSINLVFGSPSSCPAQSATFLTLIDQILDDPIFVTGDPDLTFFKDIMGFRDDEIQHTYSQAIKFYNDTYGLDFTSGEPNNRNELFFENAVFEPRKIRDHIMYRVIFNNWIQTGNTRTNCRKIHTGELGVRFIGDQLLRGSYGGDEGMMAGIGNFLGYGFYRIDVCDQSPVIIQFQSASPFRVEPVDGITALNFNLYNNILGYGRARGTFTLTPEPDNSGKFHFLDELTFLFP